MMISLLQLAQAGSESFRTIEYDLPESSAGILTALILTSALFALTIRTSLRDSRFLRSGWRVVLLSLRVLVLLSLLAVLINPRERTQRSQTQRSRVGILVDTSLSMAYPATEDVIPTDVAQPSTDDASTTADNTTEKPGPGEADEASRAAAIRQALVESDLLKELSQTHQVSVYTFDRELAGPRAVITDGETTFTTTEPEDPEDADEAESPAARVSLDDDKKKTDAELLAEWRRVLQPVGSETRLGESLHQLVGELAGRTLSGIVVLTDGRSNAGLDTEAARLRAEQSEARLVVVGVGSTTPQVNLWVAGMQSPTDVHRGDPFDISVTLQGSGLEGESGTVQLFQQSAGSDGDRRPVATKAFSCEGDGIPSEVRFQQQIKVPGQYEYVAVARLADGTIRELMLDDNQRQRTVEVTDRTIRVLIISSGPMRDYRFARNILFRHSGIESDVWLQSVSAEDSAFVTQEANEVLTAFPKTEADLFDYDVIVAFDADWTQLSGDQQGYLNRWVDEHSGGMIFVAGELHTPQLAREEEKFHDISVLYPVVLNRVLTDLKVAQRADTPWPVVLTPEGRASQFLRIADATGQADADVWKKFEGIYRSYPVRSVRNGAVVLAKYGNPRARTQDGQPPFLAVQFYGRGRTAFISSAETWRLRAISAEGHQRFWTGLIRDVGQGRRSRGRSRGLLLLDRTELSPGQTVTIRAQLYDSRMQPLRRDTIPLSIVDADGRPVNVPDTLRSDGRRPGQFVNVFRPARPGQYRITVPVPESTDVLQETVEVVLPNLESENPSQNVRLLDRLAENDLNSYLTVDDVKTQLAALLPDRSEAIVVDEQLKTLWDRQWVLFALASLLALEWALRRVVKLS